MLAKELDDEHLRVVEDHLRRLASRSGVLISAELGKGNKGTHSEWMRSYRVRRALGFQPNVPHTVGLHLVRKL